MFKMKRSPRQIAIGLGALGLCGICGVMFSGGDKDKDASSTATATAVAPADSPVATEPPSDETETAPAATEPPTTEPATVEPPTVEPPTAEPPTATAADPTQPPAAEQPPAPPVAAFAGSMKAEAGTCPDSHPIKGNINEREDTKIYHMPGSQSYRQTKPEECFATEGDAQAAGYKPRQ